MLSSPRVIKFDLEKGLMEADFTYLVAGIPGPGRLPLLRQGLYLPAHSLAQSSNHPAGYSAHISAKSLSQG